MTVVAGQGWGAWRSLGGGQQDPGGAGGFLQPGFAAALLLSPAGGAVGPFRVISDDKTNK